MTRYDWKLYRGNNRSPEREGSLNQPVGNISTQVDIDDLPFTTSRVWRFTVQAFNGSRGSSILSETVTLPSPGLVPQWGSSSISKVNVDSGHNTIKIRWGPATVGSGTIAYIAQLHRNSAFEPVREIIGGTESGLTATFTGLSASTDYYVRVIAVSNNNRAVLGRITPLRTDDAPVTAPSFADGTEVQFNQVTKTSFRAYWIAATPASGLSINRYRAVLHLPSGRVTKRVGATSRYLNVPADVSGVTNDDIPADTPFRVQVWAEGSNGEESAPIEGTVRTLEDTTVGLPTWPAGSPTLAQNADDPYTKLDLSWVAATGATKFRYQYSTSRLFLNTANSDVFEVEGTGTSVTIDGLEAETTYWVRIAVGNDRGYLPYRQTTGVATAIPTRVPDPPVASGDLTIATETNPLAINIDWTPASGVVDNYEIRRSTNFLHVLTNNPDLYDVDTDIGSDVTSYRWVTDVQEDTTYYFLVIAWNAGGRSSYPVGSVTTPVASPAFASDAKLTLSGEHASGFDASWDAAARAESYDLSVWRSSPAVFIKQYSNITSTSQDVEGLTQNINTERSYVVIVRAQNASGYTPTSLRSTVTLPAAPAVVPVSTGTVTLDAGSVGTDSFSISWDFTNTPADIRGYEVAISVSGDDDWDTTRVGADVTTYPFSGLDRDIGTEYDVRVRAVNEAGDGNWLPDPVLTVTLDDE